jgi:DNA-binding NarL/FixJ family response regulator
MQAGSTADTGVHQPTVLIADDHPAMAESLERWLGRDFQLLPSVTSLAGLEAALLDCQPDIVVLDIYFPEGTALGLLPALRARFPSTGFLVYSGSSDPEMPAAVVRSGAVGFVAKGEPLSVLREAVWRASIGRLTLPAGVGPDPYEVKKLHPSQPLTPRQRECLVLLQASRTHKEMAVSLGITVKAVEALVAKVRKAYGIPPGSGRVDYQLLALG